MDDIIIKCNSTDAEKIKKKPCIINGSPFIDCDGDCKFCKYSIKHGHVKIKVNNV